MRSLVRLALFALLATAACRTWPPPTVDARTFDPSGKGPLRVVLFPPLCTEVDGGCASIDVGGMGGRVAAELELAGYTVVDGAGLVASARSRETAGAELRLFGEQVASADGIHQSGALFNDLPPAVRRQVLEEARAEGIVRVSVVVSPSDKDYPFYGVRNLAVQARLGLGVDEKPAWAVRCEPIWVTSVQFIGGPGRSYSDGADEGARCLAKQAASGT